MKNILLITLFLFSTLCFSQDPFFTNTNQSLIYLNPSFSGSNGFIRNQTFYRNQWSKYYPPTYVTHGNAFDAYIKPLRGGISISAIFDDQWNGTLKTNWFNLAYAQYFSLMGNKLKIIPSAQFGFIQETLDKSKLNFGDMINGRYGLAWNYYNQWGTIVPSSNKQNINFSSGLLINYKKLNLGASVFNVFRPDIGLYGVYKLPIRTCVHASYNTYVQGTTAVNFSAFGNFQMGTNRTQINATAVVKKLIFGIGYYSAEGKYLDNYIGSNYYYSGFIGTIGLKLKILSISYSYDNILFTNSGVSRLNPSNQISLSFSFKNKKDSIPKFGMENW